MNFNRGHAVECALYRRPGVEIFYGGYMKSTSV